MVPAPFSGVENEQRLRRTCDLREGALEGSPPITIEVRAYVIWSVR